MNRFSTFALLFSFFTIGARAQQKGASGAAPQAVQAYAKGENSYLAFTRNTYKADKTYQVFKVWNDSAPLTDTEKEELQRLKLALSKKGIELVMKEWKTEDDLKAIFAPYKIEVSAADGRHINLKSGNSALNTTSAKALYVVENGRPVSLCSGTNCEDRAKYFFKLKALN